MAVTTKKIMLFALIAAISSHIAFKKYTSSVVQDAEKNIASASEALLCREPLFGYGTYNMIGEIPNTSDFSWDDSSHVFGGIHQC